MSKHQREMIKYVLEREWEPIVILLGLIATLLVAPLSVPLLALNVLMVLLLGYKLYRTTRQARRLLQLKHLPVIVLVWKGEDVAHAMWQDIQRVMSRWGFDAELYRREFDVEREDLFLHREEPLPTDSEPWIKLAREFRRKIERLGGRLPGRRIFHVFINGPISLAAGLGASLGTMYEVVVHHWFPATTEAPYHPAVDFYTSSKTNRRGMHLLEDAVTGEFRYVQSETERGDANATLYMSVWMARDDPRTAVNSMAQEARAAGQSVEVFHILQKEPRSLETTDDWILCAREILTLFYQQAGKNRPRICLFLSAPIALTFTLGMGIEHFLPVTVYNWWGQERRYYPVLPLDQLGRTAGEIRHVG